MFKNVRVVAVSDGAERKMVQDNRRATVRQITEDLNQESSQTTSERTAPFGIWKPKGLFEQSVTSLHWNTWIGQSKVRKNHVR